MTIAQLLSHTSGMPTVGPDRDLLAQSFEDVPAGVASEADRERHLRAASDFRVADGDRFFYSNTGYNVLGRIVEAVDGRDYATYVREEILAPLEMDRATFDRESFEADGETMTGYGGGEGAPTPQSLPFEELLYPSAGLVASPRELSRFLRAMMTDGRFDGARVADAETVERLQRPRAVRQTFLDGAEREYGFGWTRQPLGDDELVGHAGGVGVSAAYAGFLADAGLGVVVACNTVPDRHPADLAPAVLAVARGEDPTAVPAFALEAKCEAVTGTYASFRGDFETTVEREGGGIALVGPGNEGITAFPASLDPDDHEFYAVTDDGARHPVAFDLGGEHDELFFRRTRLRRTDAA